MIKTGSTIQLPNLFSMNKLNQLGNHLPENHQQQMNNWRRSWRWWKHHTLINSFCTMNRYMTKNNMPEITHYLMGHNQIMAAEGHHSSSIERLPIYNGAQSAVNEPVSSREQTSSNELSLHRGQPATEQDLSHIGELTASDEPLHDQPQHSEDGPSYYMNVSVGNESSQNEEQCTTDNADRHGEMTPEVENRRRLEKNMQRCIELLLPTEEVMRSIACINQCQTSNNILITATHYCVACDVGMCDDCARRAQGSDCRIHTIYTSRHPCSFENCKDIAIFRCSACSVRKPDGVAYCLMHALLIHSGSHFKFHAIKRQCILISYKMQFRAHIPPHDTVSEASSLGANLGILWNKTTKEQTRGEARTTSRNRGWTMARASTQKLGSSCRSLIWPGHSSLGEGITFIAYKN